MIEIKCILCGDKQRTSILFKKSFSRRDINKTVFSARRNPDSVHYQINKCERCGMVFSSPVISSGNILKLYKNSKFNYQDKAHLLSKTYLTYLRKKTKYSQKSRILDIGCGNGFFLKEIFAKGNKNIYGVELSKDAVSKASKNIKDRIKLTPLKKNIYRNDSFDLITCFHTLDHVIDPNNFMKTVFNYLKPKGQVFFIVHDVKGLSVKVFGEKSPIFDIEHIFLFNENTLKKLFLKNEFRNIKTFKIRNSYSFYDWLISSPFPLKIKKPISAFLKTTGIGKMMLHLKAGNIGIIASKRYQPKRLGKKVAKR
ncbi:MAG: hypothetical protein A2W22_00260 [Candidatus Levybacteria bacterium RBG_16_35_11]|nr:MAG: hypothetical protein A2W22_00260 [Candidatus Levybacteria bacterium RBG_16_35_11]